MAETIAVIGAGVIGGAVARCLIKSPDPYRVIATRRRIERLGELEKLGVEVIRDNVEAAKQADIVFICVKPGDVAGVLKEIAPEIDGKLVISTAAIISLEFYDKAVPGAKFVRTMPNVAAFVGESFTAYSCNGRITDDDKAVTKRLLDTMGQHEEVEEKYMDAITGLSGSGPAYVAIVIEALMYAGLKVGLPRELSLHSSAQAVLGAAKLILEGEMNASQIKDAVTTPGGTTIEGIYQLEDGKLRTALMNAVVAATEKCTSIRYNWNNGQ
ncbi:MAG: pyrroline-5-carboxylate reductase [Candidatus Bathyarchaeota archaeon]|nr:pyrroline-5-carboxylate reductase [Candidatus Bathyarchaeota archaeon]